MIFMVKKCIAIAFLCLTVCAMQGVDPQTEPVSNKKDDQSLSPMARLLNYRYIKTILQQIESNPKQALTIGIGAPLVTMGLLYAKNRSFRSAVNCIVRTIYPLNDKYVLFLCFVFILPSMMTNLIGMRVL